MRLTNLTPQRLRRLLMLLPLALGAATPAHADQLTLQGGSRLQGIVLRADDAEVRLLLAGGDVLRLKRADVAEIEHAPNRPIAGQHLRYIAPIEDEARVVPGGLDVAVTTWIDPQGGPRVDLVGAVNIAEASFFRAAQRRLDRADVVLFEGVMPEGTDLATFQSGASKATELNPVRELQARIGAWFGLTFQLDGIDYTRPHFVHADLTAEAFAGTPPSDADAGAGEAPSAAEAITGPAKRIATMVKLMGPLLDSLIGKGEHGGPLRASLKRAFARTLGEVDVQKAMAGMMPGVSDLLLTKRNAVVIERLKEQRTRPEVASIAVFYGAAHMEGLEEELTKLGYQRAGAEWLRGWDVE